MDSYSNRNLMDGNWGGAAPRIFKCELLSSLILQCKEVELLLFDREYDVEISIARVLRMPSNKGGSVKFDKLEE